MFTYPSNHSYFNVCILPIGVQIERAVEEDGTHCCLVAIGRLQVTSTPNTTDLAGSNSNAGNVHL